MGAGLVLLEALRTIDGGADFDDARQAAVRTIANVKVFFAVGTLEYLAKSGRIGRGTAARWHGAQRPSGA